VFKQGEAAFVMVIKMPRVLSTWYYAGKRFELSERVNDHTI